MTFSRDFASIWQSLRREVQALEPEILGESVSSDRLGANVTKFAVFLIMGRLYSGFIGDNSGVLFYRDRSRFALRFCPALSSPDSEFKRLADEIKKICLNDIDEVFAERNNENFLDERFEELVEIVPDFAETVSDSRVFECQEMSKPVQAREVIDSAEALADSYDEWLNVSKIPLYVDASAPKREILTEKYLDRYRAFVERLEQKNRPKALDEPDLKLE